VGLPPTVSVYWRDSYLTSYSAKVVKAVPDEKKFWYLVLDETIFHPKGGGQPSDKGLLLGVGFSVEVRKAMFSGPVVVHWGRLLDGAPEPGPVKAELDWEWRYLLMRRHSAAHLLDHSLAQVVGREVETLDSWLGDSCYVAYKGDPPSQEQLAQIEKVENETITRGGRIEAREVAADEVHCSFSDSPNFDRLPSLKQLRLVTIQGCRPIACGGTHLRNISEAKGIKIKGLENVPEGFRIHYDVF
jgi:alanyl-tRNA synthetase